MMNLSVNFNEIPDTHFREADLIKDLYEVNFAIEQLPDWWINSNEKYHSVIQKTKLTAAIKQLKT